MKLTTRLKHSWNAFLGRDPTNVDYGHVSSVSPNREYYFGKHEGSTINNIKNRIAVDCAAVSIQHCRMDKENRYLEECDSGLNNCLTLEANIDQTSRNFVQDAIYSMLDEGQVALVPVETDVDPTHGNAFDIITMRTAKILSWYPEHIKVQIYNERTGRKIERVLPKRMCAILENPFYEIMNEPSSNMARLKRKLLLLDKLDSDNATGKLDLIIQLPYAIKTETKRKEAQNRMAEIEKQLSNHKYGIAYTDGTEKVVQLNRAIENNLLPQIQYLTDQVYLEFGVAKAVLDGTADENTKLNYLNSIVKPCLNTLLDELKRKFLSKTARTRGQSIEMFIDAFTLVPTSQLAELADKFTRNEILTSNEFRQILGYRPSDDHKADQLVNSNINQSGKFESQLYGEGGEPADESGDMSSFLDELEAEINKLLGDSGGDET